MSMIIPSGLYSTLIVTQGYGSSGLIDMTVACLEVSDEVVTRLDMEFSQVTDVDVTDEAVTEILIEFERC